jgi:hypothetical protein
MPQVDTTGTGQSGAGHPHVHHREVRGTGGGLTIEPISTAEHLAFVRTQRPVSFPQTPAWGRVKTE